MKILCPTCGQSVPAKDVELAAQLAKCTACDEVFSYSLPAVAQFHGRPLDARAIVERTKDSLRILVPVGGMRPAVWVHLGFAVSGMVFMTFWTVGVLGVFWGGLQFPLFQIGLAACSIPFWIMDLAMLAKVFGEAKGVCELTLDAIRLRFLRQCGPWRSERTVPRADVQLARFVDNRPPQSEIDAHSVWIERKVEIVHRGGVIPLPVDSQAEGDWLCQEINASLSEIVP